MSLEMWEGVGQALTELREDDHVRVVILTGAGDKAFMSGADISQFEKNRHNAQASEEYNRKSEAQRAVLAHFPKPTIACIRGFCLGGGMQVAMSADMRFASDNSQFGIPAAKLGIAYGYDGLKHLVSLVGPSQARLLMYTGLRIDSAEALRIGLVDRVIPDGKLWDQTLQVARTISGNAPLSIKASKLTIAQVLKDKDSNTSMSFVQHMLMVVTRDGGVPLVGHAYPGNYNDVKVFPEVVDELVARYRALAAEDQDLTVVFDAGQNSAGNFTHLADAGLQFVGSLPPSDYPDLLAIPARRLAVIDAGRFPGLTGYETRAEALGATRRVLLTHSATLHAKQSRGFDQTIAKAARKLAELAARLERGRTRRDRAAVEADIAKITRPRWLNRVLATTVTGDKPSQMRLTWAMNDQARRELETELFGKRILVTSRDDWPSPKWSPATAPSPTPKPGSASSKTHTWCPSARCTTGPTRRSGCTSPTASPPSQSPT